MEIQIKQYKEDKMVVWFRNCPDEELLTFFVPASAVPHEILCQIFKYGSMVVSQQGYIDQIFDYHYDQVKLAKVMLDKPRAIPTALPFGKHKGVPFEEIPEIYLQWLSGTGRLESPEHAELKKRLISLKLISDYSNMVH